ncbi:LamG-like jellyroll fold domain-containing protein [Verrucomicrobiaceae bacterium 227]
MKYRTLLPTFLIFTQGIASANLLGYWDFEANFSDISGNGNDGTAIGNTTLDTTTAAAGTGSLKLVNADDSYLDINPGSGMNVADEPVFTISMWVNSSTLQDDKRIFSEGSTTSSAPLYNLGTGAPGTGSNQLDFYRRSASATTNDHNVTTAEPFGDATWHNVIVTDASGQVEFYVDGVLDRTASYTDEILGTDTTTFGGIKREGPCCGFSGSLDDIAIWDVALNSDQIQAIQMAVSPLRIDASLDADSDGLPDYWELLHDLDPDDNGTVDINNGPNGNLDADSLNNLAEFNESTNPNEADTDADGVNDDVELADGSDPTLADTDSDGVNDGDEKAAGTSPNNTDSDSDGLLDGFEAANGLSGSDDGSVNPNNGASGDPDNDQLDNLAEQAAGTDPQNPDSDSDQLKDGEEVNVYQTDPLNADSDGDLIPDGEEVVAGADSYVTNPLKADTDSDTINDKDEIDGGSDPTDGNSPNALAAINTNGLVHLWNFDETEGTVATDLVSEVNGTWLGTATNLGWTAEGLIGGAADLAGQTDNSGNHFTLPELAIEGATQMTISVWFQIDGNQDSGYNSIFMSRPENWGIALESDDTQADFRYDNQGIESGGSHGYDLADKLSRDGSAWHHAALSVNTETGEVHYAIDGEVISDTKSGGAETISGIGWAIGNDGATGTSRDFDGRIDDLAVWNTALTPEEIGTIYMSGLRGIGVNPGGARPLAISDIAINSNGSASLTWNSVPNATYSIRYTTDLSQPFASWPGEVDDSKVSDGEVSTLTTTPTFIDLQGAKVFFAVERIN